MRTRNGKALAGVCILALGLPLGLAALIHGCSVNVNTCAGVLCGEGEVCQNGSCVDPCANITCEPDADDCTVDACNNGVCAHNPATCSQSADCPAGCNTACIDGLCRGF